MAARMATNLRSFTNGRLDAGTLTAVAGASSQAWSRDRAGAGSVGLFRSFYLSFWRSPFYFASQPGAVKSP